MPPEPIVEEAADGGAEEAVAEEEEEPAPAELEPETSTLKRVTARLLAAGSGEQEDASYLLFATRSGTRASRRKGDGGGEPAAKRSARG